MIKTVELEYCIILERNAADMRQAGSYATKRAREEEEKAVE